MVTICTTRFNIQQCFVLLTYFFLRHYNFNLWMFCPSQHIISTYCDPGCGQSNFLFSISSCNFLCRLPIFSLVSLVVVLISVSIYVLFLPSSLPAFVVNGQTSLIFVLLYDLLYSCVLFVHLIHRLFWLSMYHLSLSLFCRTRNHS